MDRCAARLDCRRAATAARAGWAAHCRSRACPGSAVPSSAPTPRTPATAALPEAARRGNGASICRHTASHSACGNVRGDAAVGDDLDVAVGHQHVDQHAVVVLGVPDAELAEHLERALARRQAAPQLRHDRGRSRRRSGSPRRGGPRTRRWPARWHRAPRCGKCRRVPQRVATEWRSRRASLMAALLTSSPRRRRRRSRRHRRRSPRRPAEATAAKPATEAAAEAAAATAATSRCRCRATPMSSVNRKRAARRPGRRAPAHSRPGTPGSPAPHAGEARAAACGRRSARSITEPNSDGDQQQRERPAEPPPCRRLLPVRARAAAAARRRSARSSGRRRRRCRRRNRPARKAGAMVSAMMRLDIASVSTPSRP